MAYRLKTIRYKGEECRILLQNENGPCPLLAAANALLLRGSISFPAHCIRNGVASLEDVTNMLANQALLLQDSSKDAHNHHFIDELLQHIPTFQYGMDVNLYFTQGITGYEYTAQLNAFDLLRVKLVHGWLVDPQEDSYEAVGKESYNALVEKVIEGNEAAHELDSRVNPQIVELETKLRNQQNNNTIENNVVMDLLDDTPIEVSLAHQEMHQLQERLRKLRAQRDELTERATRAVLINHFLDSTSHQLTLFGLHVLHEELKENELVVFFRNNHFGTLTKHQGLLYLLVTDLGYANTPDIVWEKLDVIDGDTELVNVNFQRAGEQRSDVMLSGPSLTPEQLLAQSSQKEADYQLALQLSRQTQDTSAKDFLDDQEGQLMAAATEASLRSYHGLDDTKQASLMSSSAAVTSSPSQVTSAGAGGATTTTSELDLSLVAVGIPVGSTAGATVARLTNNPPTTAAIEPPRLPPSSQYMSQEEADQLLAMQLQNEQEEESLQLARKLQDEENQRVEGGTPRGGTPRRQQQQQVASPARAQRQAAASATPSSGKDSGCIIS